MTLLFSCEGVIRGKGKVISAHDKLSIDSVKISFFSTVVYSDKNGNFEIGEFVGCVPSCPDLEVLLAKQGYETKYVNLTKESAKGKAFTDLTIELTPAIEKVTEVSHDKSKSIFYYVSITTAIISFLTLIFLVFSTVKNKILWMFIILFCTLLIQYNYLAKDLSIHVFRPSIFYYLKSLLSD